jgi:small multidrug resistance pump
MKYLLLAIAIISEVTATSALKASNGFTRIGPSILVLVGYGSALYFLSLTLRVIPVGVAYAIWSGAGVSLITVIAWVVFRQRLDAAAIVGLSLIASGVMVLFLFSKTAAH